MRLTSIALLTATIILAGVDSSTAKQTEISTMTSPDTQTADLSLDAGQNGNNKRFLRGGGHEVSEDHVERRLPSVGDILKFDKWIDKGHTKETIFKKLGLEGLGEKVFTHPNWEKKKDFGRHYNKVTGIQV